MPRRALQLIQGSLRAKYTIAIVALEIILMGAVVLLVERHQRRAILDQTQLRAITLGTSLASLSEGYLLNYNFAKLEQAAAKVTADDDDVMYTIIHLRDGKVAAFSEDRHFGAFAAFREEGALQGKMLNDPITLRALQATKPWVQDITTPQTKMPGYDVAIPVYITESSQKWGTVRLGFSLGRAYEAIEHTRHALYVLSLVATVCGALLAVLFSREISKPVGELVLKVREITAGAYDQPITTAAKDEIGYLARAFEQMRLSLLVHITGLAEEKDLLAASNQHLQETQQQLLYLAARVAHEVNNPLGIIKTAMRLLRDEPGEDVLNSELFQIVDAEVGRIARIVQEILAFSRPSVPDASVDVNALIHSLEHLLTPNLQQKGIALTLLLEPALPHVRISADHLTQVLLNMVRNAEDAMPEGGQLTMQTTRSPAGVEMSITDTGCGIPAEDIRHLFDPFFTTKGQGPDGGTGLGLAVSYGIIHHAEGDIEVESELRKGSTFRVSLPACKV
jgi:signal transduction histidine kinase